MATLTPEEIETQAAIEAPQIAPVKPIEKTEQQAPIVDFQLKKRGRPKGSTKTSNIENTGAPAKHRSASIDDIRGQVKANAQRIYDETPGITPQQAAATAAVTTPGTPDVANLIDGYIVLLIMDAICPAVIKIILKKKLVNIPTHAIALSEGQKKSLEPLADNIARYLVGYVNPLYAFLIVSGLMYYQNAQDVIEKKK